MGYVLIIESDDSRAGRLSALCQAMGLQARVSPDPLHGLMCAVRDAPLTIVMDESNAGAWADSVVHKLRKHRQLSSIPLVVLMDPSPAQSAPHPGVERVAFARNNSWRYPA